MLQYEDSPIETRLRRWSRAGITLGVLLTGLGYLASWRAMRQAAAEADRVTHGHVVRTAIEATLAHATEVETGARGFAATGEQTFLDPFLEGQSSLPPDLDTLRSLTADDPVQQKRVESLRSQINDRLEIARRLIAERQRSGTLPAKATFLEGKDRMDAVRVTIGEMQAEEARLLDQRTRRAYAARRRTEVFTLISTLAGATLLILAGFITGREINRSVKMRGQIEALNQDLERRVEERTEELRESEERLRLH